MGKAKRLRAQRGTSLPRPAWPTEPDPVQGDRGEYQDDAAHRLITRRGWHASRDTLPHSGDLWDWTPSQVVPENDDGTFIAPTSIMPIGNDQLEVSLAAPEVRGHRAPKYIYTSLDTLSDDLARIEAYRHGHQLPDLSPEVTY